MQPPERADFVIRSPRQRRKNVRHWRGVEGSAPSLPRRETGIDGAMPSKNVVIVALRRNAARSLCSNR